ncbi:MAG: hypothetical protein K2L14_04255 [Duncaniella sp.]|nr:hypothetical protein [Duncaniella sp.]
MDYKELLDITLELEGLLMIKLNRGGDAPAGIDELISKKISSLSSFAADEAIAASVALEETDDAEPFASHAIDAVEEPEETDSPETSVRSDEPVRWDMSDVSDKSDESDESDLSVPAAPSTPSASSEDTTGVSQPSLPQPPISVNDVAKAFTLNDKFRFRRELFRNSDAELTETLDVLQAMESLEEAEDYLYNDLAWDPENAEVQAFIALLAPCYSR